MTSGQLGVIENAGEFDLAHWDWLPDLDPDPNLSSFVCDQRPPDGTAVGNNDAYWCNPEYDKLYLQQQAELDINKRWEIVHQMQKIFYEDNPYVVLWYLPVFNAWRNDRFTGYQPQPAPNGDPLEGYGGPSKVWWTLRPVGEGGTLTTKGVSSTVWLLVAGVVLVLGALLLKRRRRTEEDEV